MARKKKHPEHVNNERWLVSYADFITLLFAFFTTLYAISTIDQKKAGKLVYSMMTALHIDFFPSESAGGPPQAVERPHLIDRVVRFVLGGGKDSSRKPNYARVAAELLAMAQKPALNGRVQIRLEARGVVVSLAEAGFFNTGSAELKPEAMAALAAIAEKIAEWSGLEVLVEGHTDNVPIRGGGRYRSNWELSTARAVTVLHLLIEKHEVDPLRLSAAGYGEYRPVASNDTADGRSRNRRVDIVLRAPGGSTTDGEDESDAPPEGPRVKPELLHEKPEPAAHAEKATAEPEKAAPKAEKGAPKAEKPTVRPEKATSEAEKATPEPEKATPAPEKPAPKPAPAAAPEGEEAPPAAHRSPNDDSAPAGPRAE